MCNSTPSDISAYQRDEKDRATMSSLKATESLKARIERAFAEVVRPANQEIADSQQTPDGSHLSESIKDKDRDELSAEFMMIHGLSPFSAAGFQYFIPAYLIAALEPQNMTVRKETVWTLTPNKNDLGVLARFKERTSKLTDEQRAVIDEFVSTMKEMFPQEFAFGAHD
jgi:hypothetical protein